MSILCIIIGLIVLTAIYLDVNKKMDMTHISVLSLFFTFIPHSILLTYYFIQYTSEKKVSMLYVEIILIEAAIFVSYIWGRINILPYCHKKQIVNHRLKIMIGGRKIILYGLYTLFIQLVICSWFYVKGIRELWKANHNYVCIGDITVTILFMFILMANGLLRVIYTSRRLNIIKRIIAICNAWVPIVNIFVMLYICYTAKLEYEHECYKVNLDKIRADSEICKTKYPLVMIHGVGFRDFKYINYWGRIPKELIKQGATVYYGNQEAFGTVEYNANDIKEKILKVVQETGCEKVNIIAHSKGGLDSRYMVSKLDMGKYVASITMISSPHRGVKFVDIACKLPDVIYKAIAKAFNKYFKLIGDRTPDFYTATRQFSTYSSKKFNEEIQDVEGIYYQSYASVMKNLFSDYILTVPYVFVKLTEGENDGLVSVTSAKWGEFKGILSNKHHRGISHGDVIDLRRDDYKGFDIVEKYVEIISDLKEKGY